MPQNQRKQRKTMEAHVSRPRRRTLATTPPPPPHHHHHDVEDDDDDLLILKPVTWFINCFFSLSSPVSLNRIDEPTDMASSSVAEGVGGVLFRKLGFGIIGAVYVFCILVGVMVVSVIFGVGLVRLWVEEPVFVQEPLHFDYTNVHPTAVFSMGGVLEGMMMMKKKKRMVPMGHTIYVSIVMVMPESDYNQQIGVFQVSAEVISTNGNVLAKSSQPCMLRFKSLPVHLMHTFVKGIPLLLGISGETQKITVDILKLKEGYEATNAIRAKLQPRAGTSALPQLYSAEILAISKLPWTKEIVFSWKWTFYVWTSLYIYLTLLIILGCCFPRFLFPTRTMGVGVHNQRNQATRGVKDQQTRMRENRDVSDIWRKRPRNGSKKKTVVQKEVLSEVGSSDSSVTVTREEVSTVALGVRSEIVEDFEGFTDVESVCLSSSVD